MALREVLRFPDKRLKGISKTINEIDAKVRELARDMIDVMYDEPGIGLAAPQIGDPVRLIVLDTEWTEEGKEKEPLALVNPEIIERSGKIIWTEGCLSVPDFTADVERSETITVRGLDLDGKELQEQATGLRSVCFQHEIDHLDGILFIDRISRLRRSLYIKKRKKSLRNESVS